jgi:hypothetical protein
MSYDPTPLIPHEAPRLRRRRRTQQQSGCCCLLVVGLALVIFLIAWRGSIFSVFQRRSSAQQPQAVVDFPLEITSWQPTYLRFELVRLSVKLVDAGGRPVLTPKPPAIVVSRQGQAVTTVGNAESVVPRYDRNTGAYLVCWPIPWNAPAGEYIAEVRLKLDRPDLWVWETPEQRQERLKHERHQRNKEPAKPPSGTSYCVARTRFLIQARPVADIPKGTCVATWEPDFRPNAIPKPTGGKGDWHAMMDWCQYIGADTVWFRGAVTETYEGKLSDEQPFNTSNIQAIPQLAAEAHHRGLRFGAWAAAFATYPRTSNRYKPRYQFAQDISLGSGGVRDLDFISLLDRKRVTHLANFFAQVQADPNVDYVGLDYMRSDRGGYEMVDQFVREMPVKLPPDFQTWPKIKRWEFAAHKIEQEWQTDPNFYECWDWWRAHTGAGVVRDIIQQSGLKKPLWIFVLSWRHGIQHGQDPIMFTDAGASLLCPMLYQVPNRAHFNTVVRDWNQYLNAGQVNLAPGDQVDFFWHQKTLQPAAPEEMADRILTAHRKFQQGGLTLGTFWHDISRAAYWGDLGPYTGYEWALAGGSAFTTIRNDWRVYPLVAALQAPPTAILSSTFQMQVKLTNIVRADIKRLNVHIEKTPGVTAVAGDPKTIGSLGAGQTLSIPLSVRLNGPNAARANRFMVCVRLTWPDADYGKTVRRDLPRQMLLMKYVQGKTQ